MDLTSGVPYWEDQLTGHTQWEDPNPAPKPVRGGRRAGRGGNMRRRSFAALGSPGGESPGGYAASPSGSALEVGEDSLDSLETSGNWSSPDKSQLQSSKSFSNLGSGGGRRSSFRQRNIIKQESTASLYDDSHLNAAPAEAAAEAVSPPRDTTTDDAFMELARQKASKNSARRANESVRDREIREKAEWENSIEFKRYTLEMERLHGDAEDRHKTKAIDVEAYTGNWSKDKNRRRSF